MTGNTDLRLIFTWPAGQVWRYNTKITQVNAGATTVGVDIKIQAGTELRGLLFALGPDDYAAGRTVRCSLRDRDGAGPVQLLRFAEKTAIDNEVLRGPILMTGNITETTALQLGSPPGLLTISGQDVIRPEAVTLAQNETFTITIRAVIVGNKKPTTTLIGANATEVEAYNEFAY